jgi:hypothetical protein
MRLFAEFPGLVTDTDQNGRRWLQCSVCGAHVVKEMQLSEVVQLQVFTDADGDHLRERAPDSVVRSTTYRCACPDVTYDLVPHTVT